MYRFFTVVTLCLALSACSTTGSVLGGSGTGSQLSLSGSVAFVQSTAQNIQDAYTITVSTLNAIKVSIERRVNAIQQGVEKIQEGKELIEDGVL